MHGFYGRFLESVKKYPELIAVELQRASGAVESVSYAELHRRGESVANWLRSSGLTAGARCAIIAPNAPRWVAAYLGIMASGGVVVPLDTSFNAQQVSKLLRDSGSTFLFTDARLLPVVEKAVEGTSVRVAL
ncbi:MAG TPA: AMP-binding protein, partial [Alphaproteobacteria bacterium]|nr:AMP-binding protein [Alphaproteobacteria bacterium]